MSTQSELSARRCATLLASVAVLAFGAPALAQDDSAPDAPSQAQEEPDDAIPVILVTAQQRQQSLQEVPVSAQVVTGEAIAIRNVTDLSSLTETVSGVTVAKGGSSDVLMIRGIGSGTNGGFEQSVGTYVDGVYLGRSRATRASLFDLDRVEVLKGPQTTFFGNSSIAGAFNITSASPKVGEPLSGHVSALASFMHGETNFEGAINIPLGDTLAFRVAARQWNMDGYERNTYLNEDAGGGDETFVRGTLVWEPSESFDATAKYFWGRSNLNAPFLKEVIECDQTGPGIPAGRPGSSCVVNAGNLDNEANWEIQNGSPEFSKASYNVASLRMNLHTGPVTVTSISAYIKNQNRDLMDLDSGPYYNFVTNQYDDLEQYSQELRLTSEESDTFDWMAGVYYQHEDISFDGNQAAYFPGAAPLQNAITAAFAADRYLGASLVRGQKSETRSAFASGTLHLSPSFRISAGLRYTSVDKDSSKTVRWAHYLDGELEREGREYIATPWTGYMVVGTSTRSGSWNKLLPSVGIEYDIADRSMVYAKYSSGFKAGGFDFSDRDGTFIPAFDSETVDAYEAGLKARLLDGKLLLNTALFYSDYTNVQDSVLDPDLFTFVVGNAAASSTRGVEFDVTYRPVPPLTISLNGTVMDAHYDEFDGSCSVFMTDNGDCPLGYQDLAGKPTVFAPDYSGTIKATYTLPLGDLDLTISPELFVSDGYFLQSDQDPFNYQPAFERFDMRVALERSGEWEIALLGKNLTNTKVLFFGQDLPGSSGSYMVGLKRSRSISIQARYSF
jgi:outer membrane receptor protein involved in Fe transport